MPRAAAIASRAALAVLLAAAFLRALVMLEPFPSWSGDPTLISLPMTGVGPAGSLLLDTVSLFAAAIILAAEPFLARRVLWIPLVLVCIGSLGILNHAVLRGLSLDNLRIGAGWVAALFTALAAAHAGRDAHTARLIAATAIGLVAMLAAKGFVQVFIEHAETVDQYRQNREMFLAAQGWTPGSAAALNFERRLDQPEATTWFGLANVTASFAAAGVTALVGWTWLAWRETRTPDQRLASGFAGLLTIGALAALAALILCGAKGGYAAAFLGLMLLLLSAAMRAGKGLTLPRAARSLAPILPIALIAAALGALALRGMLGERIGELSLLFRWFYISTATRIFFLNPQGIGPAGFQDAYQLLKPAISPEEVTSPHSVLFDLAAGLGVFGLALVIVFILWASRAGIAILVSAPTGRGNSPQGDRGVEPPSAPAEHASLRPDLWFVLFATASPTLVSAWVEAPMATPDSTLMRLLGLAGWVGVALSALALMRLTPAWRIPFAAAAVVLAVHGQIEVTPTWAGSTVLYFLVLAAAGAAQTAGSRVRARSALAALPALLLGAGIVAFALPPLVRWERGLRSAALRFESYTTLRDRYEALRASPRSADSPDRLSRDIRASLPAGLRSSPPSLELDLASLFVIAAERADLDLRTESLAAFRTHLPTLLATSRLNLQVPAFEIAGRHPIPPGDWADRAENLAMQATDAAPGAAPAWGWLGTLRAARYEMDGNRSHLEDAIAAWTRAAALDPHGLSMPLRLMRASDQLGNADQARLWANRALEANESLRLDPLKQLSPEDLAEVRRHAGPRGGTVLDPP